MLKGKKINIRNFFGQFMLSTNIIQINRFIASPIGKYLNISDSVFTNEKANLVLKEYFKDKPFTNDPTDSVLLVSQLKYGIFSLFY